MSPMTTRCPKCSNVLEADGVCMACFFNEALEAPDIPSESLDGGGARIFATAGPLPLPCEFGGYRLLREIGSGGMGVVYAAEDRELRRVVALKIVRLGALARREEIARFRAEAEMAAQLDHPNIVPIHDVGEREGIPFFTMRVIAGMSLAQKLSGLHEPLPAREVVTLLAKVARAVQHAHERGVLHRDLKPANILLDAAGEPFLTDFGLAKLLDDNCALTRTTAHLGTPHYMSPEQAAGRVRQITTASDVWGLGVLLHQMLTLKLPFNGESSADILRSVSDDNPARLALSGVNADLATLVARCLEKEPSKRPASAGFLAEELERWLAGEPIFSRPVDAWERLWRWAGANRAAAAAAAIALAAILTGSGVALWQWRQAVQARDLAQRQLRDAEGVTRLLTDMLRVFDNKQGGPLKSKEELLTEFLKKVELFEGDPQRQIELITKTGTLLDQADNSRCYRKAAEIAQRTLPPDDPQIWYLRWRAASTSPGGNKQADWVNPELRTVYEWHRDHLGPEHPQTLQVMHSLAKRITPRGGHVESLRMLEQIRDYLRRNPDKPPPVSVVLLGTDYMSALMENGRVEEGMEVGRESCRRALEKVTASNSHEIARSCFILAKCCRTAGKLEEAVQHFRHSLAIFWRFEGPATEGAQEALGALLSLQRQQQDTAGMIATHRDALRAFDMVLGPARPETHQQIASFARFLVNAGRPAEADALFEQWLNRLRGSDGKLAPEAVELERLHAKHPKATGR